VVLHCYRIFFLTSEHIASVENLSCVKFILVSKNIVTIGNYFMVFHFYRKNVIGKKKNYLRWELFYGVAL
jgi:hypothetical protein